MLKIFKMINIFYYIFKLKKIKKKLINENKNYDLIDELFGCPWYSLVSKIIILFNIKKK